MGTERRNDYVLELSAVWGTTVLDRTLVRERRTVTVGAEPAPGVDLVLESLEGAHEVAELEAGGRARITAPPQGTLLISRADGTIEAASAGAQIGPGEQAIIAIAGLNLVLRVAAHEEIALGRTVGDHDFTRLVALTAMVHGFFVSSALLTPGSGADLLDGLLKKVPREATFLYQPEPEPKRPKLALGRPAPKPEGAAGPKTTRPVAQKGPSPRVDAAKRKTDLEVVRQTGLLAFLGKDKGATSSVMSAGMSGINNAMAGLGAGGQADAGGAGGLGTRGTGPGGGGPLGIGALHTGDPSGRQGGIDLSTIKRKPIKLIDSCGVGCVVDNIDKRDVASVIHRNLPRFKHCYEHELNAYPDLRGKVAVRFMIGPMGSVLESNVQESTMDSSAVETCVVNVMKTLKFTAPKGGGVAVVTYPFVFASAGQ